MAKTKFVAPGIAQGRQASLNQPAWAPTESRRSVELTFRTCDNCHLGPADRNLHPKELTPPQIGHGVAAIHDPALLERLICEQVVLDVCPNSNVAIGLLTSLEAHPVAAFWAGWSEHDDLER